MLRVMLIAIMAMFFLVGCEETDDAEILETYTFTSENVKEGPTNYFSFATNTADTTGSNGWDVKFATFSFTS